MNAAPRVASRRAAALACAVALTLGGAAARANPNPDLPTPMETLQLPPYCQSQFGLGNVQIPPSCGVWMNHYCFGLVFLGRANDFSAPKLKRQNAIRRARQDINYTKDHMVAGCPIAGSVQAADMRLKALEMFVK